MAPGRTVPFGNTLRRPDEAQQYRDDSYVFELDMRFFNPVAVPFGNTHDSYQVLLKVSI